METEEIGRVLLALGATMNNQITVSQPPHTFEENRQAGKVFAQWIYGHTPNTFAEEVKNEINHLYER